MLAFVSLLIWATVGQAFCVSCGFNINLYIILKKKLLKTFREHITSVFKSNVLLPVFWLFDLVLIALT